MTQVSEQGRSSWSRPTQHVLLVGGELVVSRKKVKKVQEVSAEGVDRAIGSEETVDAHVPIPPRVEIPRVATNGDGLDGVTCGGLGDGPNPAVAVQPR